MKRLLIALLALAGGLARAEVVNIDNEQLARLQAQGVPVIDIRTEGEWRETGIVPGSRLLTFFDERGRADAQGWLTRAQAIVRPDQPVIVICRSGNRTQAISRFLSEQAGYRTIYNARTGIRSWMAEGRPVVPAGQTLAACKPNQAC